MPSKEIKTMFRVEGPFKIPLHPAKNKAAKLIAENLDKFWAQDGNLFANRIGCYVFGIRVGRNIVPWYVGKTRKSFEQECFQKHKQDHYAKALADVLKGTPVMFFVTYPLGKPGKTNEQNIDELETFLIQLAIDVNPKIRNISKAKDLPTWGVEGVVRGRAKPTKSASHFKKAFWLHK